MDTYLTQKQPQDNVNVDASLCICPACLCLTKYVLKHVPKQAGRSDCAETQGGYSRSGRHHRGLKGKLDHKHISLTAYLLPSSIRTRLYPSVGFMISRVATGSVSLSPLGTCLFLSPIGLIFFRCSSTVHRMWPTRAFALLVAE